MKRSLGIVATVVGSVLLLVAAAGPVGRLTNHQIGRQCRRPSMFEAVLGSSRVCSYLQHDVARGGPSSNTPTQKTLESMYLTAGRDIGDLTTWVGIDPAAFQRSWAGPAGLVDTGFESGAQFSNQPGSAQVTVEVFETADGAWRYHENSTHRAMDQYVTFDREAPPVGGATTFTCTCGDVWVGYVRGRVRVVIEVLRTLPHPRATADQVARDLDHILLHS